VEPIAYRLSTIASWALFYSDGYRTVGVMQDYRAYSYSTVR